MYRAQTPGLAMRVYVMVWDSSAEEDRYLAGLRREKEAFEQLIRERAVSGQPSMPVTINAFTLVEHGPRIAGETECRPIENGCDDSEH